MTSGPQVDAELLLAHLDYARWATGKIVAAVELLPASALTEPVTSSFPTLLATLQHTYGWHKYYFIHLRGERAERGSIDEPATFGELKRAWAALHRDTLSWAKENLAARKDVVLEGWGTWPTWMIVLQMASHATHHFGQVVTLVRQLGYPLEKVDSTDLIRYLLRRFPQENQNERVKSLLDRDTIPVESFTGE